jgi:hypothetical protein
MIRSQRELARQLAAELARSSDPLLSAGAGEVEKLLVRAYAPDSRPEHFDVATKALIAALIIQVADIAFGIWRELKDSGTHSTADKVRATIFDASALGSADPEITDEIARAAAAIVVSDLGNPGRS